MTTVRVYFEGERAGPQFQRAANYQRDRVLSSVRLASQDAAEEIQSAGRADIKSAGRFGTRWTEGFRVTVSEGGGNIRITATEDVPYWTVFQYGATIHGKPMLWIPLSFAEDAHGVSARDFPGQLFRVDRKSGEAPLLLSAEDREPKYFGKESVTIPKKFHLIEIIREHARLLREYYRDRFKQYGK